MYKEWFNIVAREKTNNINLLNVEKNDYFLFHNGKLKNSENINQKNYIDLKYGEYLNFYKKEYDNYQGKPEQIERRSSRNKARRLMGDKAIKGKDVGHKDNNPLNNDPKNLKMEDPSKNRREPRLREQETQVQRIQDRQKKEKERLKTKHDREDERAKAQDDATRRRNALDRIRQ